MRRLLPPLLFAAWCVGGPAGLGASVRPSFPVTLRDALGHRVTVRAEPQRIVSLAPAMTEILFALGLERKLVGVTDYCDYPPRARAKPRIGGIVNPSTERILALRPELVIGMRLNPKPVLRTLAGAGIPTYAADPRDIEQVMQAVGAAGALTGRAAQAAVLVRQMRSRLQEVRGRVRGLPRATAIMIYQQDPLWVAGAGTFPDHLIRLAGGRNAASDVRGYKQYSVEMLLARNPDVILLTSMTGGSDAARLRDFLQRPSMREVAAVRRRRVYVINADIVDRAGPRIVAGLEAIAARLHPQAFRRR